jgi:bifunctional non-homologous end joining protein LigD
VIGWTEPQGSRSGLGALLVGYHDDGDLRFGGKVGTGFGDRELTMLSGRLRRLERSTSPMRDTKGIPLKGVHWCDRSSWRRSGSQNGPRMASCVTLVTSAFETISRRRRSFASEDDAVTRPVEVTRPDKLLWPAMEITKRRYVDYLDAVGDRMLPWLRERPLTLVRAPDGVGGQRYYQKDTPRYAPSWIRTVAIPAPSAKREVGIEPPPSLKLAGATPWRWPLGLKLTHRIELARIA